MASPATGKGLVTVFGGSGFVGRHIVRALARRGWRVRAAVRRPDLAGHLQPMGTVGQIHAIQANVRFPDSVARAVASADAVVNCIGILAPDAHQSFADVHVEGAKAIATAAREEGIDRLVHISALGADADGAANYAVSKAEGEAAVLAEIPGAIILRPSVIFGAEDEFFNRFAAMARIVPLIPAIGGGRTRFQPVYVGDVAEAVANAVEGRAALGQIYELGGPEVLSFAEIVERIGKYTGRNVKPFPIPFVIAKAMAVLTSPLPGALRPFTYDQIKMLQGNSVVSDEAHSERRDLSALGIDTATSIDAVVPSYLEHYRPRGQYSHYRS